MSFFPFNAARSLLALKRAPSALDSALAEKIRGRGGPEAALMSDQLFSPAVSDLQRL